MKPKRTLPIVVLLFLFMVKPAEVPGCGSFFPSAVFTLKLYPQVPLDRYARGELGVLLPSYARKFLVAAYRHLSDRPLSLEEREAFLDTRDTGIASFMYPAPSLPGLERWKKARGSLPGMGAIKDIDIFSRVPGSDYQYFANCTDGAFENAAATLEDRIKTFGAGSDGIRKWAEAQDAVFSNCSSGSTVPEPAEAGLPTLLVFDRQYQIAAARFYAGEYDTAAQLFKAIADTDGSPWKEIAPYLAARSMIRKATVVPDYGKYDGTALAEADAMLKAILEDKTRRRIHAMARGLSAFVSLRLRPAERLAALSAELQDPAPAGDFKQNLTDYLFLFDRRYRFEAATGKGANDEMTEWIVDFQSGEAAPSIKKWKETGKPAWLLAAISKARPDTPELEALTEAALKIKEGHPGFLTARYHRIRLLLETVRPDAARGELDALLPMLRSTFPPSCLNLFLEQRLALVVRFEEFLKYAPRVPATINDDFEDPASESVETLGRTTDSYLDDDAVGVLNRGMPLSMLGKAAVSELLPEHIRRDLTRVAWTRAVLLEDDAAAGSLTPELQRYYPELGPDLQAWRDAGDAASRRFAAALLLQHFPGMSPFLQGNLPRREKIGEIDNFRDNWWCGLKLGGNPDRSTSNRYGPSQYDPDESGKPIPTQCPGFLTEKERQEFDGQWSRLAGLKTAPDYFGEVVIAWAKAHPQDARVPEALHLVVKSSRVGCTDADTGAYSREAFRLLHAKYPGSPWTEKTPYWYK